MRVFYFFVAAVIFKPPDIDELYGLCDVDRCGQWRKQKCFLWVAKSRYLK